MSKVKRLSILAVFFCYLTVAGQVSSAKPLVLDTAYQGPVSLEISSLGLAFTLPKGWQGIAPSSGEGFAASYGEGIQVILAPYPGLMSQLKQELAQGSEISPGLYLLPKGQIKEFKDGAFGGHFTLPSAEQANIYAIVKPIKDRSPVVTLAVCITGEDCRKYADIFYKSIKSIAKSEPKQTKPSGALASALANKRLNRYFHGSGYSEKMTMTLCADGRYYSSFNASSVSVNGSGGMNSSKVGQWSVSGQILTVREANGEVKTFQVHLTNEQLLLNQDRWLREDFICQ